MIRSTEDASANRGAIVFGPVAVPLRWKRWLNALKRAAWVDRWWRIRKNGLSETIDALSKIRRGVVR